MEEVTATVSPTTVEAETPLRKVMREQGRQQKWLAAQIGPEQWWESQVSDYCRGVHVPTKATRRKIAQALGVTESSLWPTTTK